MMRLMIVIVRDGDADNVSQALVNDGYRVTRMASTGGFLRRGNTTLMVGVEESKEGGIYALLQEACSPPDSDQHRATVFALDITHYEQL